jgi:hypothetical protein
MMTYHTNIAASQKLTMRELSPKVFLTEKKRDNTGRLKHSGADGWMNGGGILRVCRIQGSVVLRCLSPLP